jgi:hypothetical protein
MKAHKTGKVPALQVAIGPSKLSIPHLFARYFGPNLRRTIKDAGNYAEPNRCDVGAGEMYMARAIMISLPRLETNAVVTEVERSTDSELHHRNQLQHGSWILQLKECE